MTRRTVLAATGLAAGTAVAVPFLASAAQSGAGAPAAAPPRTRTARVPRTRSASFSGAEAAAVESAEFPVEFVAVAWTGAPRGAAIRLLDENGTAGAWQPLKPVCAAGADGDAGDPARRVSALVATGGAAGYELRMPDGATSVRSAAIDTVHGPSFELSVPAGTATFRGIEFITRAGWGADESLRFKEDGTENSPQTYYPVQTLTVHHTADANGKTDPAAAVRAYYQQHAVENDWGDIGYHFLIDEEGQVYEGRFTGDDGIPAHNAEGQAVTAFHTSGFNSGNIGIAVLGSFDEQDPTAPARATLTRLLAALADYHDLDPEAAVTFVNPVNGVTKDVRTIGGHRDWLATECPGTTLYDTLPTLRKDVAAARTGA
ncbi:peptidoglycan recognition family protein [Streptomyces sp. NPDC093085]|uniref:peptidoglycan recognition protein family protein n=1 Tax=Streptomyces sp. NPDC093085 TaxID=3155068 RepID=UPI00341F4C94